MASMNLVLAASFGSLDLAEKRFKKEMGFVFFT
jgi:hypothetical protein